MCVHLLSIAYKFQGHANRHRLYTCLTRYTVAIDRQWPAYGFRHIQGKDIDLTNVWGAQSSEEQMLAWLPPATGDVTNILLSIWRLWNARFKFISQRDIYSGIQFVREYMNPHWNCSLYMTCLNIALEGQMWYKYSQIWLAIYDIKISYWLRIIYFPVLVTKSNFLFLYIKKITFKFKKSIKVKFVGLLKTTTSLQGSKYNF